MAANRKSGGLMMDWKEFSREDHACPCGEGTVAVIHERDSNHRVRTRFQYNCTCVPEGLEPYPYEYQRDGLWHTVVRWVKTETLREVARLRGEADALLRQADEVAEARYLDRWLNYFGDESKRAVWKRLREIEPDNIWFPALPTFYRLIRDEGIREYLIRHFRANPRRALDLLGIEDRDIVRLRADAVKRMEEADRLVFRE